MSFEVDEAIVILPCHKNHILHFDCYEAWKKDRETKNQQIICPYCRKLIDNNKVEKKRVQAIENTDEELEESEEDKQDSNKKLMELDNQAEVKGAVTHIKEIELMTRDSTPGLLQGPPPLIVPPEQEGS